MDKINLSKAYLTLSFDDCFSETLECSLPVLGKYNFKGTYNVIAGKVGSSFSGFPLASWKQLNWARDKDMEIASHSLTHKGLKGSRINDLKRMLSQFKYSGGFDKAIANICSTLPTMLKNKKAKNKGEDKTDIESEVFLSKKILDERLQGQQTVSFVYPGGAYNPKVFDFCRRCGYLSARSSDRGFNKFNHKLNLFSLKIMVWTKNTTVKQANKWVDFAIKNKVWLVEVFHLISPGESKYLYFTYKDKFSKHIDYVAARKDEICIETQGNIIERWLANGV